MAPAIANTKEFERGQTLFEAAEVVGRHAIPAAFDNALAAFEHAPANRIIFDRDRNVMQQSHSPAGG